MTAYRCELPWPPSVNRYLRRAGTRMHTTNEAKAYRASVGWLLAQAPRFGRHRVRILVDAFPPDNRRRDLDNIGKCLLDAVMHAGVFEDDSQVDELTLRRKPAVKGGTVILHIERME